MFANWEHELNCTYQYPETKKYMLSYNSATRNLSEKLLYSMNLEQNKYIREAFQSKKQRNLGISPKW